MTGGILQCSSAWARAEFPMLQKNEVGWQGAGDNLQTGRAQQRGSRGRRPEPPPRLGMARQLVELAPWQETCPGWGCEASVCGTTWQLQRRLWLPHLQPCPQGRELSRPQSVPPNCSLRPPLAMNTIWQGPFP